MQMGSCIVFPAHGIGVTSLCSGCHCVGGDGLHLTTYLQMIQSLIQARQNNRGYVLKHYIYYNDLISKQNKVLKYV